MKKILPPLTAIMLALSLFSFTKNTKSVLQTCTDSLVWFNLASGEDFNCASFASVMQGDVVALPRVSADPIADLATYTRTQAQQVLAFPQCPANSIKVCAVGYTVVSANFTGVTIGGQPKWVPSIGAQPVCKTCRTTVPAF